jgi:hypothetical protein
MPRRNSARVVSSSCCISAAICFMPCMISVKRSADWLNIACTWPARFAVDRVQVSLVRLRSSSDVVAHELELLLDGLHAVVAGLGDDAGDLARPGRRGVERFVKQGGEALQPLPEIVGARVECRNQRLDVGVRLADRLFGAAIALSREAPPLRRANARGRELRRRARRVRAVLWWSRH